jgi:hypothetical protein
VLAQARASPETEIYDAARIGEEGISAVWIPLSASPVLASSGDFAPTGRTYVDPSASGNAYADTSILMFIQGTADEDMPLQLELTHNWEAIPYPSTNFLFDTKSVVSSEDDKAKVITMATNAHAVDSGVRTAAHPSFWSTMKDSVFGVGKRLFQTGLKQVERAGLGLIGGLTGGLLANDYANHVVAVHIGKSEWSPANDQKMRGLTTQQFLEVVLSRLNTDGGAPTGLVQKRIADYVKVKRISR